MKSIKIILFITLFSVLTIISCDSRQTDGGSCEYIDITERVKVINITSDSNEISMVEFKVINSPQTIRLYQEDFEIMKFNPVDIIPQSDTATFLLSGKKNTVGACQPFLWQKIMTP